MGAATVAATRRVSQFLDCQAQIHHLSDLNFSNARPVQDVQGRLVFVILVDALNPMLLDGFLGCTCPLSDASLFKQPLARMENTGECVFSKAASKIFGGQNIEDDSAVITMLGWELC